MAKPAGRVATAAADPAEDVCGIIMPISAMPPDYDAAHWADVRQVLYEAIERAGMQPQIVSDSFESDVIQRRIVHNLYENDVVVCDVSGLNPNVMFELGMRLTFKKPVVVVTDDVGRIPFDTGVIEHLPYPRDLHIHKTNDFSQKLTDRIRLLRQQVKENKFRPYLEAFGTFEVFQPSTETVPADRYIAERLDDLIRSVRQLEKRALAREYPRTFSAGSPGRTSLMIDHPDRRYRQYAFLVPAEEKAAEVARRIEAIAGVENADVVQGPNGVEIRAQLETLAPSAVLSSVRTLLGEEFGGAYKQLP